DQRVLRRAGLQPRDHACNLARADVEGRDQLGAIGRYRPHLWRLAAMKAGHASVAFFLALAFNASARACAASSERRTVTRSGKRRSIATMSRDNRWSP